MTGATHPAEEHSVCMRVLISGVGFIGVPHPAGEIACSFACLLAESALQARRMLLKLKRLNQRLNRRCRLYKQQAPSALRGFDAELGHAKKLFEGVRRRAKTRCSDVRRRAKTCRGVRRLAKIANICCDDVRRLTRVRRPTKTWCVVNKDTCLLCTRVSAERPRRIKTCVCDTHGKRRKGRAQKEKDAWTVRQAKQH